jgi:hypothetical protein
VNESGMRMKHSFSLGQCSTVFHLDVYAIKACAIEDIARGYKNKNICIL